MLTKKGKLIIKSQDIIHNHRMHCTHQKTINWCEEVGFRLLDLFVLTADRRMRVNKHEQKHARIFHSYFMVMTK